LGNEKHPSRHRLQKSFSPLVEVKHTTLGDISLGKKRKGGDITRVSLVYGWTEG